MPPTSALPLARVVLSLQIAPIQFDQEHWQLPLQATHAIVPHNRSRQDVIPDSEVDWQQRLAKAELLASRGELSHASRLLRSSDLAPGTDETLAELTNPEFRPQVQARELPSEVLNYIPDEPVQFNRD